MGLIDWRQEKANHILTSSAIEVTATEALIVVELASYLSTLDELPADVSPCRLRQWGKLWMLVNPIYCNWPVLATGVSPTNSV